MMIKTFKVIFEILIGKVPENKREYYREVFSQFIIEVVRAGVKEAVREAKEK